MKKSKDGSIEPSLFTSADNNVVPLPGKHLGRPIVEVIQQDPNYIRWASSQPDLVAMWPLLILLAKAMSTTSNMPTPDHNELQTRFLDEELCQFITFAFAHEVDSIVTSDHQTGVLQQDEFFLEKQNFEELGFDVEIVFRHRSITWTKWGKSGPLRLTTWVEIKPYLGDDYPAVLRQMKDAKERVRRARGLELAPRQPKVVLNAMHYSAGLVYRDFKADGATLKQVRAVFEASGFFMVSFAELES